jgi:ATP-binding cassette subfamily B protein
MPEAKIKAKKETDKLPKVPFRKVVKLGLKINMTAIPFLYIIINIISIAHGVAHGYATYMTQRFYDSVEQALRFSAGAKLVFASILALGAVFVGRELLNGLDNFLFSVSMIKCQGEASRRIHTKMGQLDPVCLEDTKMQDQINKAEVGAENTIYILNIGITVFTFYLPYFIFMAWYLNHVSPKFILAILFVFLPTLVGQFMKTRVSAKFEEEAAPIRRRYGFYEAAMTSREFFKETRLLGAYKTLIGRFVDTCKELSSAEWLARVKENRLELVTTLVSTLRLGRNSLPACILAACRRDYRRRVCRRLWLHFPSVRHYAGGV